MTRGDEIEALLFDVGQVILRVNVPRAARLLADGAGKTPEHVIAAIESDPQMVSFQEGRLAAEEWHQHLRRSLGLRHSFEEFCRAWNSALEPEPLLGVEFFAALAPRLRLGLLSNTDPIHVQHFESHFEVVSLIPVRLYSCTEGMRKPAPALYERAIAALGTAAEKMLYMDDVEEFVEGGKRAGLQTYHCRDPAALSGHLRERGLLR